MATSSTAATVLTGSPYRLTHRPAENVWRAPLVPAALLVTAGILIDRQAGVPLPISLTALAVLLLAWVCTFRGRASGLTLVYLALAALAFGAAYHHYRRDWHPTDDIAQFVPQEPRPTYLRGRLDTEPTPRPAPPNTPLRSRPRPAHTTAVLRVSRLRTRDDWIEVSGLVQVSSPGEWGDVHCGDKVEVVGVLEGLPEPANPGEFDIAGQLRDQGISALLVVRKTSAGVVRLERRWPRSLGGWLAAVRGHAHRVLRTSLPPRTAGLAAALLLGEDSALSREEWDKYIRTGVIHVLAISGQHLVVLAGFFWYVLPRLGVRPRRVAWVVALVVFAYAVLTGARPATLRAAVMVGAACAGLILRRRVLSANLFALAWLAVALLNPMDLFTAGCLFSFLAVAVLYWLVRPALEETPDPLQALVDASRPAWQRTLRRLGRNTLRAYFATLAVWLAVTPLAMRHNNLVAPVSVPLGPPLVFLTDVALLVGFPLLLLGSLAGPLAWPFAWLLHLSLATCDQLVDVTEGLPCVSLYFCNVPSWWLVVFYVGLLAVLTHDSLRRHWGWAINAGLAWLCLGLAVAAVRPSDEEFRCTFLAVGHGGCIVMELPDGRTLLYDTGSLAGPDVTRRQIAPYLWHRGIRRIDEIFLSHADLDHFNGLLSLLERFPVAQVTWTPSFADKQTEGVRLLVAELRNRHIPTRMVKAGDRLDAGDVTLQVLHPPAVGPEGTENARSLVLLVQHAGHRFLFTGDLEGAGLDRVLALPRRPIDVLLAPHHGSRVANTPDLAKWARPRLAVACWGRQDESARRHDAYKPIGARLLGTWPHGAVTIRSSPRALLAETFVTGQLIVLRTEADRN